MSHHTLIETTIHGEQTRRWFCPLCHFTCASAPSPSTPSLTDLRRHFLLSLLTVAQEAQATLHLPETAHAIREVIDRAAEEMEEMEEEKTARGVAARVARFFPRRVGTTLSRQ